MNQNSTYEELTKKINQIEKSEKQFHSLFNAIPVPTYIWQWDGVDFILIIYNESSFSFTNGKIADFVGVKATELHRDDAQVLKDLERCFKEKSVIEREMGYQYKSTGKSKYLSVKYSFVHPDLIMVHTEDITERKKTEDSLRDSMHRLSVVLSGAKAGIWSLNLQNNDVWIDENFRKILCYNPDDIPPKLTKGLHHPDDWDQIQNKLTNLINRKTDSYYNEHRLLNKQGHWIWVSAWAKIFDFDDKGKPVKLIGAVIDITERKRSEKALIESEALFRSYFELPLVGRAITSPTKGWIKVNDKLCNMLGYTNTELKSMTWVELTHPDDLSIDIEQFNRVIDGQIEGYSIDKRFMHKNGDVIFCSLSVQCLRKHDGSVNYFVAIIQDITDRKLAEQKQSKLEEQLQHAQKMEAVGTLAGGIAHDFNNMLGVITGNASYALNNVNKNDELHEVLLDVQESAKQAQNLTHQLLTFSKGGAPIKKVTDINRLIKESAIFSTRGAKTNCIFELPDNLWSAEVDEGQINQVIGNLVINANQAMPNGGAIIIRTENTEIEANSGIPLLVGQYIKIVVEDQGVGISKKHLPNIFEPYYTTKQKGSGLGLATVYSIIKRHGGHITVYSEIDKGTVFNIYLPASSKDVKESEDKGDSIHTGQGKILIMDDQGAILKMVGRMLNRMGYVTAFATDGSQAVEMYKEAQFSENAFDFVILDLTVPGGMGGLKTIIELLKIDPNVKAAVSSGYSNDPIMANFEDYGFCGVVPKPYTKAQLSEVLNKIFSETG
ncbi:multi-sensor hybrid histidine kinase [Candidatus Magnetomorum sp. HK-1]|nr:multi-sensor hybrid histidine kinase [Candidatus Magnetomorum sp. HK-1]